LGHSHGQNQQVQFDAEFRAGALVAVADRDVGGQLAKSGAVEVVADRVHILTK
jgi:hypothetical protein